MIHAVIDIETTGFTWGVHEMVQLAIVPYHNWKPINKFVAYIRPTRPHVIDPKAMEVNGLDIEGLMIQPHPASVRKAFLEWKHDLFGEVKIFPMGHNYKGFDANFLFNFFSPDLYKEIFHYHARDTMSLALGLMDKGELPEMSCSLSSLIKHFKVDRKVAHDAYEDAIATLAVYRKLIGK